MSYGSSYCLFRTTDRPRRVQPSLRDFGCLLRNPTLERVGYSQISLREIGVGYSRISSPGDGSRKPHRLQQHTAGKCPNSRHPSGVSLPAGHGNGSIENSGEPSKCVYIAYVVILTAIPRRVRTQLRSDDGEKPDAETHFTIDPCP